MKKLLSAIIFLLLLSSLSVMAQPKGMGKNDVDAKKILDDVSSKFKSFKAVTASFNLKIENAAGKIQGSKTGTVSMKGNKYRVSVTGQEIFFDGSNIWTYDKSSNEVQITKFDESANMITPQKLFTNFYDKDFLYKSNGESTVAGKTIQQIELTPIDKSKPFFKVLVSIDKRLKTITSTKVFEKNGNRYTYSVSSLKTNNAIPDALFVFDAKKYPNVELVDLR
ncbi:MAG: outer membrane lipoprotein carrier protein LolA [Chitinophagaceae bacterium]|nr:outer membrane lipoprotein carrier protein LolA [Chitinophagaceae bacterium]